MDKDFDLNKIFIFIPQNLEKTPSRIIKCPENLGLRFEALTCYAR